jgi:hypothetical protein
VVIQVADRARGERLNAGIAIFSEREVDLRLPKRLDKFRAMSAALDAEVLRAAISNLAAFDKLLVQDGMIDVKNRVRMLSELTTFEFTLPTQFSAHSHAAYEEVTGRLLKALIEPEPPRMKPTHKRTKLASTFKKVLRKERLLARPGEDLDAHRVVSNLQIAEGLAADFVLKNGAMHVIETVDASDEEVSPRRVVSEIAISALVLEQSRMTYGEQGTTTRIVYDASAAVERIAMTSLMTAAHQGAELVNWASHEDRTRLLALLASLATPLAAHSTKRDSLNLHASTQKKLDLH